MVKEHISLDIDKELLQWIDEKVKKKQFDSKSGGIRRCIVIAKKVYEKASPEEKVKFILDDD